VVYYASNFGNPTGLCATDRLAQTNCVMTAYPLAAQAGLRFSGDGRSLVYSVVVNRKRQVFLYDFPSGGYQLDSERWPT
jgi:hypothetical protein